MQNQIDLGSDSAGAPVYLDVEELLATRLLVQGNSGSGKSHLLRRLLEKSAGIVQQIVIDPEGDFVSLAEAFGHVVIDGAAYPDTEIVRLAARAREHRASIVLALDGLEIENQMRCAALFLDALFEAPDKHWYPALVIVDEAQLFAPSAAGEVSDEARRTSLAAMTNLMCRGRKRGLAGVIATQRLAKLAKNVAAEASNFLMGRTFLDIDMVRAADLLGMERRQAEQIRDLERGHFLGLGPAISRRPVAVRIGSVETRAKSTVAGLPPPPAASGQDMAALLHAPPEEPPAQPDLWSMAQPARVTAASLQDRIERQAAPANIPAEVELSQEEADAVARDVLCEMSGEEGCTFLPSATLFQDFTVRCRMRGLKNHGLDAAQFRRSFAQAVAGLDPHAPDEHEEQLLGLANAIPEELLTPFLAIGKAALGGKPCPDDETLAVLYGTRSVGRARRMLEHLERSDLVVVRTDLAGRRSVAIPRLNVATPMA
ncbi:ATP-binding protein [Tsuneonella deserti]|uniref:ATP-binding protein n=1 Tax=Tsuneonella deserti TaxID=2035528 RepID=A0ABQ1RX31_9SPHN|nr:ATP-binding protein [Tsuneonella deserti]GGD84933.1 ATP-binding protein [Tsuneonella deserti]